MKEQYHRWIVGIMACVLFFLIGFMFGFYEGVKVVIEKGLIFLKNEGVDFSLTASQIAQLIQHYKTILQSGGSGTLVNLNG